MKKNNETHIEDKDLKENKAKISQEDKLINEVTRLFDDVLEKSEKVNKVYKPKKSKMLWANILKFLLPMMVLFALTAIIVYFPGDEMTKIEAIVTFSTVGGVSVILIAIDLWFTVLRYKNVYYVCTNTRLIIRSGLFGVDYKSLSLDDIDSGDVNVTFLDKMLKTNTGTLRFGGPSMPINSGRGDNFILHDIEKPYEVFKSVMNIVEDSKKGQKI